MKDVLLELNGVSKYYTGTQSVVVGLNQADLKFRAGEFVAVTGESGSGKSTLAQVICGILPYEAGELLVEGRPTSHYDGSDWERYRREKISYISQNYGILPGSTVLGNVVSALRIAGLDRLQAAQRAEELLKLVELWAFKGRRAAKLSSGQKQRLSIARALAKPAPILVADEPTGNLDSENSEKIIELLAKAARERLVILITHDFQEAEGYATRRIILQDGRVVMDAPLGPEIEVARQGACSRQKKGLSAYITGVQIAGRPVWSILAGLFFALSAFAVFAFLGTFIMNLDDTSTRIYDDSVFLNGDKTRIVVQRLDGGAFTQEDWDKLLTVENAAGLERNSYLSDWQYAWRQDVDYKLHYHAESVGDTMDNTTQQVVSVEMLLGACDFMRTVPQLPQGEEFLTAGRLPETMYEVVLAGEESRIGECFDVYIRDENNMSLGGYVKLNVTVVGTTDRGSGLYFGEEMSRVVNNYVLWGGLEGQSWLMAPAYELRIMTISEGVFRERFSRLQMELPQSTGEIYIEYAYTMKTDQGEIVSVYTLPLEEVPVYIQSSPEVPLENCVRMNLENKNLGDIRSGGSWCAIYTESDGSLPGLVLDRAAFQESVQMEGHLVDLQMDAIQEALANVRFRVRPESGGNVVDVYLYGDDVMALSKSTFNRVHGATFGEIYFTAAGYHDSTYPWYVLVTKDAFDGIASLENPNQVSLFMTDYAYTDQVLEDLQDMGYLALSPFRMGATQKNPDLAAARMKTLWICLAALAAVVILQLLVLKELFAVQNESYKLLSDMGLGRKQARASLMWQVLLFAVLGQVLAFGVVLLCAQGGVRRIVSIVRYLPVGNWAVLSAVHLGLSVLAGLGIMKNMSKRVYPQTGDRGDLRLDEEGKDT